MTLVGSYLINFFKNYVLFAFPIPHQVQIHVCFGFPHPNQACSALVSCPYFHNLNTSFLCLNLVGSSLCIYAGLLMPLLHFLFVSMDHIMLKKT